MKKSKWHKFVSMAVSAFMLLSMLPVHVMAANSEDSSADAAQSDNGLPVSTEYQKATGEVTAGENFTIVSSDSSDNTLRIVHLTNSTTKLDHCKVENAGETLIPADCTVVPGTHAHAWTVSSAEGGYTIQSRTENGGYINIGSGSAQAGSEAQILQIEETEEGGLYTISREIDGTPYYLAYTSSGWSASTTPYPVYLYIETKVPAEVLPNGNSSAGTTNDQPFAPGTGGSNNFRIPSLITLDDGSLLAAIDARWNHQGDASGLDTIISKSTDGGETWTYSFPNYFNDSIDAYNAYATAFIDPAMIQGDDGTIYLLADLWPGGVALNTAAYKNPVAGSGYEQIDGKYRLVLYNSAVPNDQTSSKYTHYVADFDSTGFAPVVDTADSSTDYYVDQWYYLYNTEKEPIYCQQLGSSKYVQQNVFYFKADLHVMATSYLWLITSKDGGETWSAPSMLNEQVRTGLQSNANFYGVGPGRGLVTSTGRIVFPCYTYISGHGDGNTSVIYSDDNGQTWERSEDLGWQTSEATVVEANGNLYIFARHGGYAVSTDGGATWSDKKTVDGADIYSGCQINAIVYSKLIDGKPAILLSCPTGGSRNNGKIYVGLVQEDGSINWDYSYSVNNGAYAYSSLTELADGSIGLLYESSSVVYENIDIADIAHNASIGNVSLLTIPLYGEYKQTVSGGFAGYEDIDTDIVGITVEDNGNSTYTVTYTGKKEGTVEFTETNSGIAYTVTVAPAALVEVSVEAGETETIDLTDDNIEHAADSSIATTEITSTSYSDILNECAGSLGTDASYTGDVVGLSNALYTFTASGSNWKISNTTSNGTVYLNLSGSGQYPGKTTPADFELREGSTADTFKLYDTSAGRHLHFYRDGRNIFDRCGTSCGTPDEMEIYRPAAGDEVSSTAIPGYVQVTAASEITDGGKYLITAKVENTYYALYPSTSTSSAYAHVIKADPGRSRMQLAVTGVAPGITDIMVGGIVYRITVNGYEAPVFEWNDEYTSATASFNRTDGGEAQVVNCTVTSQTTEATCTEDGKTVYTATAEFGGQSYTDTKEVSIPAAGHTYGAPTFTWTEDHSSCIAFVTCANCLNTKTFDCKVTSKTTDPTAATPGSTVYTAEVTIDGETYNSSITVTIPATGTDKPSAGTEKPSSGSEAGGSGNNSGVSPKTGDSVSSMLLYILALAGCGAVLIQMRKRRG